MASRSSRRGCRLAGAALAVLACTERAGETDDSRRTALGPAASAPVALAESVAGTASASPPATVSAAVTASAPGCPPDMVLIPARTFIPTAATPQLAARSSPTRVEAYCLDRTEVTTEAYAACVATGHCTAPLRGGSCSFERAGAGRKPINCVDFLQAEAFCKAAGRRLPSEAEWESAAGTGARTYPWGDDPPGKGVCWDGAENALGHGNRHDSCDVGSFAGDVSPDGVRDLGGNVTEWTVPAGGVTGRDASQTAPRRGGTWGTKSGPFLLRNSSRRVGDYDAYHSGIFTGFRCAARP